MLRKNRDWPARNDACPCASGKKFKKCCGFGGTNTMRLPTGHAPEAPKYIDYGEDAVRWVITDETGRKFFSDKDNRVIVFLDKASAIAVASLEEFHSQAANEINVAGVGQTKYEHLKEMLPYVEVADAETGAALVRERIAVKSTELETPVTPEGESNDGSTEEEETCCKEEDGASQEAVDGEAEAPARDREAQ